MNRWRDTITVTQPKGLTINHAAGVHEIWFTAAANKYTTTANHPGDMAEGTLKAIIEQADIAADQFLKVLI